MSEKVHILTDANFEAEVLQSKEPVLVDFWATWCPPCRMIGPFVDALAEEFEGRARVGKLDVDQNPGVVERYGIRAMPTLLVFKGGSVVDARIGAVPKAELAQLLETQLAEPIAAS